MIVSPYDTTACRHYPLGDLRKALAVAKTLNLLYSDYEQFGGVQIVTTIKNTAHKIPPFSHPVCFEDVYGNKQYAIDARAFTAIRPDGSSKLMIRNQADFNLLVSRAILQKAWDAEHYNDIRNISSITGSVFTRWISETLAKQYMLQPDVQLKLTLVTAFFFICQFIPKELYDENNLLKHANAVSRITGVELKLCEEVLDGAPHLEDLKAYCDFIVNENYSVRLDKLSPAMVIAWMASSWLGPQSRELIAVSLEHPVTFTTLIYSAISERGFQKTRLGDLLLRSFDKGDNFKQFVKNFDRVVEVWRVA